MKQPEALSEYQARQREWDQSSDIIRASGHRSRINASDRIARPLMKTVAKRGRPHMKKPFQRRTPSLLSKNAPSPPGIGPAHVA
jgi:hypothetical protein